MQVMVCIGDATVGLNDFIDDVAVTRPNADILPHANGRLCHMCTYGYCEGSPTPSRLTLNLTPKVKCEVKGQVQVIQAEITYNFTNAFLDAMR